jgi:hypothetical protein
MRNKNQHAFHGNNDQYQPLKFLRNRVRDCSISGWRKRSANDRQPALPIEPPSSQRNVLVPQLGPELPEESHHLGDGRLIPILFG